MSRHRDIAASPVRTAGATWATITDLVVATLDRSSSIDAANVRHALDAVAGAGCALIASGYLDRMSLTVIAPPLHLTIGTVTGEAAFRAFEDENLSPVPGAATAAAWMIYLPRPTGLAPLVDEVTHGLDGISTAEPPAETSAGAEKSLVGIDLRRLDPNLRG